LFLIFDPQLKERHTYHSKV